MDPLHDYKACVKIEQARCQLRENCDPGFDKATCYAYYEEFCRTRKMNGPGSDNLTDEMIQACIDAILQVPCEWLGPGVDETEFLPECDFLHKKPPDGGPDDGGGDEDAGGDDDAGDDSGPE
jgi:hypothetical protein